MTLVADEQQLMMLAQRLDEAGDHLSDVGCSVQSTTSEIASDWKGKAEQAFVDDMQNWGNLLMRTIQDAHATAQMLRQFTTNLVTTDEERRMAAIRIAQRMAGIAQIMEK
ncbi:MAG: WXG100 family type VII secretion target [Propionibacteriaceae bacterium]|nr:WXG100 family type VII secretion target [Propionibacteriaceae bacterium]